MKQGSSLSSSEQSDMFYDDAPAPNRIILGCLLNGLSTPKWQLAVAMAAPLYKDKKDKELEIRAVMAHLRDWEAKMDAEASVEVNDSNKSFFTNDRQKKQCPYRNRSGRPNENHDDQRNGTAYKKTNQSRVGSSSFNGSISGQNKEPQQAQNAEKRQNIQCYQCGGMGHYKSVCPSNPPTCQQHQANFIHDEPNKITADHL